MQGDASARLRVLLAACALLCSAVLAAQDAGKPGGSDNEQTQSWEPDDYEFSAQRERHRMEGAGATSREKPCAPGCEERGNCNRMMGTCECPIGYEGPTCSQPVWPSCKVHPSATQMYCSTNDPKSCSCFRECRAFICPGGQCEAHFDDRAYCFERPPQNDTSGNSGSEIPEDNEDGVRYYRGFRHSPYSEEGQVAREEALKVDREFDARPLRECPESCSYQGACLRRGREAPVCRCRFGFDGSACERTDSRSPFCYNKCSNRGVCIRGFCHCEKGWWGKDCSSSKTFAAHTARRLPSKLKVYAYDLPWQVAYQREYFLGFRDVDSIYTAYRVFGAMFYQDEVVRTENPWEANLFWIPALTYGYSSNTGDSTGHGRRAIDYVRQTWPFFNRTGGKDHFLWLTADRGACYWPSPEQEPAMAHVIKVVHYGWHHRGPEQAPGWGQLPNQEWGCFKPGRDIVAALYYGDQSNAAAAGHGLMGRVAAFDPAYIPPKLLFFAGGIRAGDPDYSGGVRQELHAMFGAGQHENVTIHEGSIDNYVSRMRASKFCLAPSGHGWGIRLNQMMQNGCVPLIIQDDTYVAYEDLLPYHEFSVRMPKSRIPHVVELLEAITDEEYLALRRGVEEHWRAFLWDQSLGGRAYEYFIRSLQSRWTKINAHQH